MAYIMNIAYNLFNYYNVFNNCFIYSFPLNLTLRFLHCEIFIMLPQFLLV